MFTVTYRIKSSDIVAAAHAIVIGQSLGNPAIRSNLEEWSHAAEVLDISGDIVKIGFKFKNLNRPTDVAQILCTIQGGQSDIDIISECRIIDIDIPIPEYHPVWGHATDRPLIGGIIKPKTGLTMSQLHDITKQMCDGGIDWIKEDEILSDPAYLPLEQRVEHISRLLEAYPGVMYCFCVNGSPSHYLRQIKLVEQTNLGIHTNFWTGMGAYEDATVFQHFQRSGIRILTDPRNPFGIDWPVLAKLAIMQGVDSMHIGMIGGYYPDDPVEVYQTLKLCQDNHRIATLSCGMNPDIARRLKDELGNQWLAAVGGWLHTGNSIEHNVRVMREAVEC